MAKTRKESILHECDRLKYVVERLNDLKRAFELTGNKTVASELLTLQSVVNSVEYNISQKISMKKWMDHDAI